MPILRPIVQLCALLGVLLCVVGGAAAQQSTPGPVTVIELTGGIDPVSGSWTRERIEQANRDGVGLVVIRLDTPGGLVSSMQEIVRAIGASRVPVAVWVGPSGSRAASAGAFISAAAPFLLMAPGTNIGSATPVSISGGDLDRKVANDASSYIASLAEANGRPAEPYRQMVEGALNLTANQAVDQGVADALAADLGAVLRWVDGRPLGDGQRVNIDPAGPVSTDTMAWWQEVLRAITNPDIVFILLVVGLLGLLVEAITPGGVIPGALGLICLLLAVAGMQALPFNWIGVALLLLGVGLMFAEAHTPGFGALAGAGTIALCLGGAFLFSSSDPELRTSLWVVIPVGAFVGGGALFAARRALIAARNRPVTGATTLIGQVGAVRTSADGETGHVMVNGELWSARPEFGTRLEVGQPVRVTRVDTSDLTITVEPTEE